MLRVGPYDAKDTRRVGLRVVTDSTGDTRAE